MPTAAQHAIAAVQAGQPVVGPPPAPDGPDFFGINDDTEVIDLFYMFTR